MQKEVRITAKDNPSVKHYRHLRDNKRARRTEGLFVAEGLRIVQDALQYPCLVQQLFVTDAAWERFGREIQIQEMGMILHISDAVGDSMSDTQHPQGVYAVCRIPERRPVTELLRQDGRYLVLCNVQDPGNMGMILRTADALGMDAVISAGSCELFSPKVVRAAMGSLLRVTLCETDALPLTALMRTKHITTYAAVPARDALPLTACSLGRGSAVLIGNEGSGLPGEIIAACDQKVTIPMQGDAESLNAAMAAGILMWEMMKSGR